MRLGALEGVLGYHVAQATVVTMAAFERHVGQPLGLRKVEYSLLMLLLANGPQSPKRLGQALVLSAPNLTLLLDGCSNVTSSAVNAARPTAAASSSC